LHCVEDPSLERRQRLRLAAEKWRVLSKEQKAALQVMPGHMMQFLLEGYFPANFKTILTNFYDHSLTY
jgi:hypothetical protein